MNPWRSETIAASALIAFSLLLLVPPVSIAGNPREGDPSDPSTSAPELRWREPVALAVSPEGSWLYVANRGSGTVSVIDTQRFVVAHEEPVGAALSALAATPDGRFLLAVDEEKDEAVLMTVEGPSLSVVDRLTIADTPVGVAIEPDSARAFVASLWSRTLTILEMSEADRPLRVGHTVGLPFEPRNVLTIGDGRVVVADAFGGHLAVVDGNAGAVESIRELPGHNIRGMVQSIEGDRLLITHQILNRSARTDMNDIHWAGFIGSMLRTIPMTALLDPDADLHAASTRQHLSDVGDGAGDPNGVLAIPGGRIAVALGGVNRVAFGPEGSSIGQRVTVGRRPVAMVRLPNSDQIAVANAFGDSVSIVTLAYGSKPVSISLGPVPEPDPVRLGRLRFYDASLSHDGWMSCHSCHTDGHANGQMADTLGDDSYGTPKRTLSLLGVGETEPWAWDGGIEVLGDQIKKSVASSMRGYPLYDDEATEIEAFLRSFGPPPALTPPEHPSYDAEAVARGANLFRSLRCDRCHTAPVYTSAQVYDVGLSDEQGQTAFNPPSLRGVGRRRLFFHDGQANRLEDVFTEHEHQLEEPLRGEDLADLIAFLKSL
ncbi:cytochrome c peroxidase [Tautonia marina]|uniref:cytochrome c peroxidase n=1 Tax=Tautonia marina TaxID=2653855 RepID=UPI00137634DB|nr:cytochrome c peroxidase [Tautonia marina]